MATVDNEVDAQMLLKSINVVEKSREILSVSLNGMVDAERVEDVKSHLRVRENPGISRITIRENDLWPVLRNS